MIPFSCLAKVFVLVLVASPAVVAFHCRTLSRRIQRQTNLFALDTNIFDVRAASTKLLWETLREAETRPVLNLSARKTSIFEEQSKKSSSGDVASNSWDQGQRWNQTSKGLKELLGINATEDLLKKCPHLFRLETNLILETAQWLVQEFSTDYVVNEPRLLSYPSEDVSYGLQFLCQMMMVKSAKAKAVCSAAPALLLNGIDGGLQERAVRKALGAAGDATRQANQKIAGEAAASLNQLKKKKRGL